MAETDIMLCNCGKCDHYEKVACIDVKCKCCNMEDLAAILGKFELEPAPKLSAQ